MDGKVVTPNDSSANESIGKGEGKEGKGEGRGREGKKRKGRK